VWAFGLSDTTEAVPPIRGSSRGAATSENGGSGSTEWHWVGVANRDENLPKPGRSVLAKWPVICKNSTGRANKVRPPIVCLVAADELHAYCRSGANGAYRGRRVWPALGQLCGAAQPMVLGLRAGRLDRQIPFCKGAHTVWWDVNFWLIISPALLLGIIAQIWVRSAYARAQRQPAPVTGAEAARAILDSAGLSDVSVEVVPGFLSDHYDPRSKVLRLSPQVYKSHSLAAVGIAAHEVGHAIQDAQGYAPLAIRNAAVPAANFGSGAGVWLLILGLIFSAPALLWAGVVLFSGVVVFQLVNLPVEFNASARAKRLLGRVGVVDSRSMGYVNSVLSAAALTYVAATLQAILTLLYYVMLARSRD